MNFISKLFGSVIFPVPLLVIQTHGVNCKVELGMAIFTVIATCTVKSLLDACKTPFLSEVFFSLFHLFTGIICNYLNKKMSRLKHCVRIFSLSIWSIKKWWSKTHQPRLDS
jgi:hypothetical protein